MCGIAGKVSFSPSNDVDQNEIEKMLSVMSHRGPDGHGIHMDESIGLGHVRLAIIGLSTGAQPMSNEDNSIWITFNGEIYNYEELRKQLIAKGHQFKSNSDTEVIVHAYEEYGQQCVSLLRGMFAFAIWDSNRRKIFTARDRVGIKPLYFFRNSNTFAFASELKCLLTLQEAPRAINAEAIDAFWCFKHLPGSISMFEGIEKLQPGYCMEIDLRSRNISKRQYWDFDFTQRSEDISIEQASKELSDQLRESIRLHMISDVPVGFLLSGGMDSSAVLTYAAEETDKEISTFTVGFDDPNVVDERPYARLMAQKYNSNHFEATLSSKQFWEHIPKLLWNLDEPVCEPPAIALHYISKVAKDHVKVLLSGEGGDEAFGGYPNYPNQMRLERIRNLCGPFNRISGKVIEKLAKAIGQSRLSDYGNMLSMQVPDYYWSRVGKPLSNYTQRKTYTDEFREQLNGRSQSHMIESLFRHVADKPLLDQLLYVDSKTWLPDDLLVKADKVTMGNSLELRVPLLDHKLLEFAARLPPSLKVRNMETKRILKHTFSRIIPPEILYRKKVGFPVPYGRWLAGPLMESTRNLLLDKNSRISHFFKPEYTEKVLNDHCSTQKRPKEVFSLLALEVWLKQFSQQHSHECP